MFIANQAETFPEPIRAEIEQLISREPNQKALKLSTSTGQTFDCHQYPSYLTGDLQAQVVLVHLHDQQVNNPLLNLEIMSTRVLQLQLIPEASPNLTLRGLTKEILQPQVEQILKIILQYPRQYIFFSGSAFEQILRKCITTQHKLELRKEEQAFNQHDPRFSWLNLSYRGETIKAGLVRSFTCLSKPMSYALQEFQRLDEAAAYSLEF